MVSLETLATIEDEELLEHSAERGRQLRSRLRSPTHPVIKAVRGVGLMVAVELDPDVVATLPGFQNQPDRAPRLRLVDSCQDAGLLLVPSGVDRVRWLPPLNVSADDIDCAADIFRAVLHRVAEPR